ncbi:MAG: PhoH family protein [Neisseriaceae bacterium]|nr:PhoH family protein [Neisseriaceae bacterium]
MSLILHHQLAELDNQSLQRLCGTLDEHIKTLAQALQISISRRLAEFTFSGAQAQSGVVALNELVEIAQNRELTLTDIQMAAIDAKSHTHDAKQARSDGVYHLKTKQGYLSGRTPRQNHYIKALLSHDVVFGMGPAGTGKTYIAVAAAVDAMARQLVDRIVLVRPAVEAGEKLGFLPGDLSQKVDPYLRPLYDALYELMGFDKVMRLLEKGLIEIAPLAYMRGRTLNNAYVILDEAQNTTPEQMKMFLTRIGFGAKAVITGDATQIDLPKHIKSGLRDAEEKLQDIDGLHFHYFKGEDVVRHPLVQKIVAAYEAHDERQAR